MSWSGRDDLEFGFNPTHQKEAQKLLDQVAGEALTIFFPESPGLTDPLPAPPGEDENILIFTDSRILHECVGCPPEPAVEPSALKRDYAAALRAGSDQPVAARTDSQPHPLSS